MNIEMDRDRDDRGRGREKLREREKGVEGKSEEIRDSFYLLST